MDAQEYKKERELLYDKANKLYQLSLRGEGGEKENAADFYRSFVEKNGLDHKVVIEIQKFKELKPNKTFRFDGMEFMSFEEFKTWMDMNFDNLSFWKKVKLMQATIFKKK